MHVVPSAVCALIISLLTFQLSAGTLAGKAVRVIDGDTVEILDQQRTVHRIRLAGIDAPETGQDFGAKAKRWLIELAAGRDVDIQF